MNRIVSHISAGYWRHIFVFAMFLLLLLTSCPIKSSLKSFASLPAKTETGLPKSHQIISASSIVSCSNIDQSVDSILPGNYISASDLLPFLWCTVSILFLTGFCQINKTRKHPLYSGSRKIRPSVPLFLEYRKLILPFAH